MTEKPFLINSIIGNGRMLATLGRNSELYRIFWPRIDNYQHLRSSFGGINAGHGTWWFVDGGKWHCNQSYLKDTNIVRTILKNDETGLEVEVQDFVEPEQDVLVRHFQIRNKSRHPIPIKFLYYSSFNFQNHFTENGVLYADDYDALLHYRHGYYFAVGANRESQGYQCGGHAIEDAQDGHLQGAVINMSPEGCQLWDFGLLQGQESTKVTLYLCPGYSLEDAGQKLSFMRNKGYNSILQKTVDYWADFLGRGKKPRIQEPAVDSLYKRSLLACALLCDREKGGIIAAPEFDEKFRKSGGYGYCWPRDCVFVANAMARAGYKDMVALFYYWAEQTQLPDGQWFQRYDTEGNLAPGWGNQIDQTGSVLWGIWQYYHLYQDTDLIKRLWPVMLKGAAFLISFIDQETGLPLPSFDLWEERIGEHAYSAAAVYGGLKGAAEIAEVLGFNTEAEHWRRSAEDICKAIEKHLWDPEEKCFFRTHRKVVNKDEYDYFKSIGEKTFTSRRDKGYEVFQIQKDYFVDISLIGLIYPFAVFDPEDERVRSTVQRIEEKLTCPRTGGTKRYEHDHYIGGNPWVNATLWKAIYHAKVKEYDKSRALLQWAVNHKTDMELLPEQVDQNSGNPVWVIPLTWSHAMFILAVLELAEEGQI